jgi:hypothetical protein
VSSVGRFLVVAGVALVVLGILVGLAPQTPWLGRLPGDLRIERPGFRLYVPIASCLLLSVVLSALLYAISRLR